MRLIIDDEPIDAAFISDQRTVLVGLLDRINGRCSHATRETAPATAGDLADEIGRAHV